MLAPNTDLAPQPSFFKRLVDALRPPAARPFREMGVSGTAVYGGYVQTREKSPEWVGAQRYIAIADMAVNASIVAAGVHYFANLIAHPRWSVEPADESGPAKEAAEFVDEVLQDCSQPWSRIVRRACMFRFYGFGVQEWTAKARPDGRVGLASVEPRPQHSIERWAVSESGAVEGVWQRAPITGAELGIPRKKILYLVDDALSDSPEGIGIFRHLAEPWGRLKQYLALEARAFERDLRGTPVGRAPYTLLNQAVRDGQLTQEQANAATAVLENFVKLQVRQSDTAIMLDSVPYYSQAADGAKIGGMPQWAVELLTGGASGMGEVAGAIVRTQTEMARLLTCEHLMMGESAGNRALGEDKSRNLYLVANSVLGDIVAGVNQDVVANICDLNGIAEALRPKCTTEDVAFKSAESVSRTLATMAQAGAVLAPDDPVIADVRALMGVSAPAPVSPELLGMNPPGEGEGDEGVDDGEEPPPDDGGAPEDEDEEENIDKHAEHDQSTHGRGGGGGGEEGGAGPAGGSEARDGGDTVESLTERLGKPVAKEGHTRAFAGPKHGDTHSVNREAKPRVDVVLYRGSKSPKEFGTIRSEVVQNTSRIDYGQGRALSYRESLQYRLTTPEGSALHTSFKAAMRQAEQMRLNRNARVRASKAEKADGPGGAGAGLGKSEPRTLYVKRRLLNAGALREWARGQGLASTLRADDMHVTVAFSRAPVDWSALDARRDAVAVAEGARSVHQFPPRNTPNGALVLRFEAPELERRWRELKDAGASWDFPEYLPHVTLTYSVPEADVAAIEPYRGPLVFGPEEFAEVDDGWAGEIVEEPLTKAFDPDQPRDERGQWTSGGGGDVVAYHGTTEAVLAQIMKEGIVAQPGQENFPLVPGAYTSQRGSSVYVTNTEKNARAYAQAAQSGAARRYWDQHGTKELFEAYSAELNRLGIDPDDFDRAQPVRDRIFLSAVPSLPKPVVLRIEIPKKDWDKFKEDKLSNAPSRRGRRIKPEWIVSSKVYKAEDGAEIIFMVVFAEEPLGKRRKEPQSRFVETGRGLLIEGGGKGGKKEKTTKHAEHDQSTHGRGGSGEEKAGEGKSKSEASTARSRALRGEERAAIEAYADYQEFEGINARLRAGDRLASDDKELADNLESAIQASTLTKDVTLYRAVAAFDDTPAGAAFLDKLDKLEGADIIVDRGFMSTSFGRGVASDYGSETGFRHALMRIEAPKGMKALSMHGFTPHAEVVFPRNTRLVFQGKNERGEYVFEVANFAKAFNPDQPREPAGSPAGGQFASAGGGGSGAGASADGGGGAEEGGAK